MWLHRFWVWCSSALDSLDELQLLFTRFPIPTVSFTCSLLCHLDSKQHSTAFQLFVFYFLFMLWWHEYTHDISLCSLQIVFIAVAIFYMHIRAHTPSLVLCGCGVSHGLGTLRFWNLCWQHFNTTLRCRSECQVEHVMHTPCCTLMKLRPGNTNRTKQGTESL